MSEAAQPTAEERQEVLSHLYVHAARVVGPLASGRYAIQTMARGQIIGMLTAAEVHPLIQQAAAESIRQYELSKREESERRRSELPPVIAVSGAASADELGL